MGGFCRLEKSTAIYTDPLPYLPPPPKYPKGKHLAKISMYIEHVSDYSLPSSQNSAMGREFHMSICCIAYMFLQENVF